MAHQYTTPTRLSREPQDKQALPSLPAQKHLEIFRFLWKCMSHSCPKNPDIPLQYLSPEVPGLFLTSHNSPPCLSVCPWLSRFRLSDIHIQGPVFASQTYIYRLPLSTNCWVNVYTTVRHRRLAGTSHVDWPHARNGQGRASFAKKPRCPIARLGIFGR